MTPENKLKLADIIVKGLLVTAITVGATLYGSWLENRRSIAEQAQRGLQASIEMTSRQKELDVDLNMRLFGTLMNSFFTSQERGAGPRDLKQRILILRLVALNFQDVPINLKPLFEELEGSLPNARERETLKEIAMEVSNRQAYRLTAEPDGVFDTGLQEVSAGDTLPLPELLAELIVESVRPSRVMVRLESREMGDRKFGPFEVSYFDAPLVDNAKLGTFRVAVVLRGSDGRRASLRVIGFPPYLAGDRIDVKALSQAYRDQEVKSGE